MLSYTEFREKLNATVNKISKNCVLVVDDNREVNRLIRSLLAQIGITNIKTIASAQSAIQFIKTTPLALVICDYHLTDGTAVDIFNELKMIPRYSHLPFLVITNDVSKEELLLARSSGIKHCILKPFTLHMLQEKIVETIEEEEELLMCDEETSEIVAENNDSPSEETIE